MLHYLFQRVLLFVPTLLIITLIAFGLTRLAPGDPAAVKAGVGAEGALSARNVISQETFELWRKQMRLDRPVIEQYILWLGDIVRLNFGVSFIDNRPVVEKIAERLPVTLTMNIAAVFIAYIIAIPLGVYSALRAGTLGDRIVTFILFALYSLPSFWVATLALTFFCNPEFLYLFPSHGLYSNRFDFLPFWSKIGDVLWHFSASDDCVHIWLICVHFTANAQRDDGIDSTRFHPYCTCERVTGTAGHLCTCDAQLIDSHHHITCRYSSELGRWERDRRNNL